MRKNFYVVILTLLTLVTNVLATPMLEPSDTNLYYRLEKVFSGEDNENPIDKPDNVIDIIPPEVVEKLEGLPLDEQIILCEELGIDPYATGIITIGAFTKMLIDVALAFGGLYALNSASNSWAELQKIDPYSMPLDFDFNGQSIVNVTDEEGLINYGLDSYSVAKIKELYENMSVNGNKITSSDLVDVVTGLGYVYHEEGYEGVKYGKPAYNELMVLYGGNPTPMAQFINKQVHSHNFEFLRKKYGLWCETYRVNNENGSSIGSWSFTPDPNVYREFDSFLSVAKSFNQNVSIINVTYQSANTSPKEPATSFSHRILSSYGELTSAVYNKPQGYTDLLNPIYWYVSKDYQGNPLNKISYMLPSDMLFAFTETGSPIRIVRDVEGTIPECAAKVGLMFRIYAEDGSNVHVFKPKYLDRSVHPSGGNYLSRAFDGTYYHLVDKSFAFGSLWIDPSSISPIAIPNLLSNVLLTASIPEVNPDDEKYIFGWANEVIIEPSALPDLITSNTLRDIINKMNKVVVDDKTVIVDPVTEELGTVPDTKPDLNPDPNPDPDPKPDVPPDWSWWDWLVDWCSKVWDWMIGLPAAIWEGFADIMNYLFIPSDNFFDDSFNKLKDEIASAFGYMDWDLFDSTLTGVGAKKPDFSIVVYGQKIQVIDLSFWDKYRNVIQGLVIAVVGFLLFLYNIRMVQWLIRASDQQHQSNNVNLSDSSRSTKGGRFL